MLSIHPSPRFALPDLYSPHHLKTWTRCRSQYYYQYVAKLRWPTDPSNFRLGTAVHKLLHQQALGLDLTPVLANAEADIRQAWAAVSVHPMAQLPTLASEWGFQVPVMTGGLPVAYWLQGRIDRVSRQGDRVWVIDWKTGTAVPKDPESDWQTLVYCYAVVAAARDLGVPGLQPEQVRFAYVSVRDGKVSVFEVPYGPERHADAEALLRDTLKEIAEAREYPLPARCPDRHCAYRRICGIDGSPA